MVNITISRSVDSAYLLILVRCCIDILDASTMSLSHNTGFPLVAFESNRY
jgi:hypothetical protein